MDKESPPKPASLSSRRRRSLRVVIADDHPLYRDAMARTLHGLSELEVVEEAATRLPWGYSLLQVSRKRPFSEH